MLYIYIYIHIDCVTPTWFHPSPQNLFLHVPTTIISVPFVSAVHWAVHKVSFLAGLFLG